jgi:uncharacterized protein YicC (UPF0701 family)
VSDEAQTKPALETILERINALDVKVDRRFDAIDKRFDALEQRLESVETLVDRVASIAYETRADVRELHKELRAHLNQFNQPA